MLRLWYILILYLKCKSKLLFVFLSLHLFRHQLMASIFYLSVQLLLIFLSEHSIQNKLQNSMILGFRRCVFLPFDKNSCYRIMGSELFLFIECFGEWLGRTFLIVNYKFWITNYSFVWRIFLASSSWLSILSSAYCSTLNSTITSGRIPSLSIVDPLGPYHLPIVYLRESLSLNS